MLKISFFLKVVLIEYINALMVKPIYSPKTLLNQILRDIVLIRRSSGEFFVIQVGANDGVHADPINKYIINFNWSGVLIEPQPEIFERLKENYKTKKNIFFENSAVTDKSGYGDMYKRLSPEKSGLTSLIPDSEFTNRPIYDFRKKSGSQFKFQVKTITFEDLINKYKIRKIDLLQIDAEGFDWSLIKMFPFQIILPKAIQFEKSFMSENEVLQCKELLKSKNYHYLDMGCDGFAYQY